MKDLCLKNFPEIMLMVNDENIRQLKKWGVQDHSPCEWVTITSEELGETSKAILEYHFGKGTAEQVVKEAIQTATLCLKIAEMFAKEQ